jgi:8-amino-7-oxononanoate synthase
VFRSVIEPRSDPAMRDLVAELADLEQRGLRRHRHLVELSARISRTLELRRWRLLPSQTAIQPLIVGENSETVALSGTLATEGILVPAIRPPTVPKGSGRLRISLSAAHTQADVDLLIDTLRRTEGLFS